MNDWLRDLTTNEREEIDAEDRGLRKLAAQQRKRARDAMRRSIIRAGKAAIRLSDTDQSRMFNVYLEAQMMASLHGRKIEVDHIVPLKACCVDKATGRKIHFACGLHVPDNLRAITEVSNRERSNLFFQAGPFITPVENEYDPYFDETQSEKSLFGNLKPEENLNLEQSTDDGACYGALDEDSERPF